MRRAAAAAPWAVLAVTLILTLAVAVAAQPAAATGAPLPAQIHTVAGGGTCTGAMTSGGACDGVAATSVPIGLARSVSALPDGAFLYVDYEQDLVREVSPGGVVSTVAGNGTAVDGADGTVAVDSGLDGPVAATPLPGGGFLVVEYNGSVVRMVSPGPPGTATITTIAGTGTAGDDGAAGAATSLALNHPTDAEPTADGQVLIADSGNNLIRLLSTASPGATLSTIAGGGACDDTTAACEGLPAAGVALHDPVSVSPIDGGAGGYLIAEDDLAGANTISQVSALAQQGTFTTVAGTPGAFGGDGGDGGPAIAATLDAPEQVVSLAGGGFVIADTGNEAIREVSATGTISTVAGDGAATYAGDGGAATAASFQSPDGIAPIATVDGSLLIADGDDGAIREVTIPPVTTIALGPASAQGANGWWVYPVTATVSTTEGATTSCELDPAAPPPAFAAITTGCPYTGAGAPITANGVHTLYAASVNAAGDQEIPVSVTVRYDNSAPIVTCERRPTFRRGTRHARVLARVSDPFSGPSSPVVAATVPTSRLGSHVAWVKGSDNAGIAAYAQCRYTVVAPARRRRAGRR